MSTDLLDPLERIYLADRLSPPAFQIGFFFLFFLPMFGAAGACLVWTLLGSTPLTIALGVTVGGLALLYFPFVGGLRRSGAANPAPDEAITWTGTARRAASPDGHVDPYIGDLRVSLPMGWEAHVFGLEGALRVRGVRARVPDAPVYVLELNERFSVRREIPLGLHRYDAPKFYFALAFVALIASFVASPACGFSVVGADGHLLGLLTAACLAYGAWAMRKNSAIARRIDAVYR